MKEFWDSVVKYRQEGIETHPKYASYKKRSDSIKNTKRLKKEPDTDFVPNVRTVEFLDDY
jgi:hypothetical protein